MSHPANDADLRVFSSGTKTPFFFAHADGRFDMEDAEAATVRSVRPAISRCSTLCRVQLTRRCIPQAADYANDTSSTCYSSNGHRHREQTIGIKVQIANIVTSYVTGKIDKYRQTSTRMSCRQRSHDRGTELQRRP